MKVNFKHYFGIISISIFTLLSLNNQSFAQDKSITLEDIWLKGTFRAASVPGFDVMNDGQRYLRMDEKGNIKSFRMKNNKAAGTILNTDDLHIEGKNITYSSFEFSADEKKILLFDEATPIYRHSTLYKTYVYDLKTKNLSLLDTAKVLHASFSPDGTKVAFVKDNNIYIKDLNSGATTAITSDGKKNEIINGNCDWVYEEEFAFTKAFQWSPMGNYLAYYRFDESRVKDYTIPFYKGGNYPELYTYKYPVAGEANSIVSIKIYDLTAEKTIIADVGTETDQYIPRIKWTNDNQQLCISRLNRHQNHLELLLANAQSGLTKVIYDEQNKYYIDITDNLSFMPDGQSFVITSERDGTNQLYLWNWEKQTSTQLTKGKNEIAEVLGVDTKTGKVFYTVIEDVINTAFYVADINKQKTNKLSTLTGTHEVQACNGLAYFVDKFSTVNTVTNYSLIDAKGKVIRVLEDNKRLAKTIEEYHFSQPEFVKIPNEAGALLNAYMIKPAHFDSNKKYPVLMYQYSGPGSQQVLNKFALDNQQWHQFLAQKGYLIVVADGTGTGGRGEEFKKMTYLQLGNLESNDQIAVAKYLSQQAYVDAQRIGIWGWSFGGFMSSTCILKAPDVFKAAIAVAPVTNWRLYDNIYTERFMRTPQENPKGYDENAPLSMAYRLKGKFLLVHGLADDNVHVQNATELSKNLVDNNKDFDEMYYTNKNHSIYGGYTRYNLYKKMTAFILNNL